MTPDGRATDGAGVTVVIVTRDRRDGVLHVLGRLADRACEVVVVDNASSDGTAAAVRAAHPDVRVLVLARNVGAFGRTLGARLARTPYVAFADDDSWWAPGSLERAADLLDAHPRTALLAARVLVGPEEREDPLTGALAGSPLPRPAAAPGPAILGFLACAAVVRREPFLACGGFDGVVRFVGEEERVALDLAAGGWDLFYVDALVVHHHPRRPDAAARRARVARVVRGRVLTALMRRPWRQVLVEVRAAVRTGGPGLRGLALALPDAPAALVRRRTVPPGLERQLRRLELR